MPAPEASNRLQYAVVWDTNGFGPDGEPTVGDPREIRVRWNWKETQATDGKGNQVSISATVVVDEEIEVGSRMWLGHLDEWYGTGSATDDDSVMEVLVYGETPDVKARMYKRTLQLGFYKDTPT